MCVGRDARVREQRGGIMHDPRFSLSRDFSPRKSPHRANEWRPIFHDQFRRQPAINYAARSIHRSIDPSFLPSVAVERWRSMNRELLRFRYFVTRFVYMYFFICGRVVHLRVLDIERYSLRIFSSLIIRVER